ncbi:metal-dependent hydrolase [Psychrobium sp. MM17-31]|uniref:metal-dependent hydrolase n=1 Tax=Psychrobium sp. MM17-31 TaxID=2917758 RepID=UPI001EF61E2B|nr:metal-dependent hydrolase [Psychrobium sp. MM17-31]
MDSLTQAVLGATVAGAVAGKRCNAKVLIAGAALGTLPDLDVLIDYGDDINNVIKHRGFSHSIFVLSAFSFIMALLIDKFKPIANWSFYRLFGLISAALITHPLLDFFTSYGTQLIWPLEGYFSASSIFIIDPAYTLPLIIALFLIRLDYQKARKPAVIALSFSTLYLGWGVIAKQVIHQRALSSLAEAGITSDKIFITPTAFNTILWRIVVIDGETYWEGESSFLDQSPKVDFEARERHKWPIQQHPQLLDSYLFFTHDLVRYREQDNQLIISDLRMGTAQQAAFEFVFATRDHNNTWQLVTPTRYESDRFNVDLKAFGQRILGNKKPNSSTLITHEENQQ